jgi:hypothetical protein
MCVPRPPLPAALVVIWFNLRFLTAGVLTRWGAAGVGVVGALFVMFLRGSVEEKKDRIPPLGAGTSFVFLGMLPCGTIEGSDFFWREILRLILGVPFAF